MRHEQCAAVGSDPEDCSGVPVNVRWQDGTARPIVEDATQVTVRGFGASCVLRGAGELFCWSLETIPDVGGGMPRQRMIAEPDLESLDGIEQASVSDGHMCVVQGTDRQVYCAGGNAFGQLGLGDFVTPHVDPQPVMLDSTTALDGVEEVIISHGAFTCARTSDAVYCWGANDDDQFGDGTDTTHAAEPCMGSSMTDIFDCSNTPVQVGGETGPDVLGAVSSMALGPSHACAVESSDGSPGTVVCWGDNRGGQGGQPETEETVGFPTEVGIDDAVQVAAGSGFSCALHSDGTISCWGSNLHGQLGDGVEDHGATCTRGSDSVDCSRTPVSVSMIDDATFIAANASHACAIRANGSVWCWGRNNNKQLGTTDRENRHVPVMVQGTDPSM
jgi:alpha-tubulin suppressor-like RCC1 family protein